MILITHVRLSGGENLEHITHAKWLDDTKAATSNDQTGSMTVAGWVDWLNKGGHAYVKRANRTIEVKVVNAKAPQVPYIRTEPDDTKKDNLLSLPKF